MISEFGLLIFFFIVKLSKKELKHSLKIYAKQDEGKS